MDIVKDSARTTEVALFLRNIDLESKKNPVLHIFVELIRLQTEAKIPATIQRLNILLNEGMMKMMLYLKMNLDAPITHLEMIIELNRTLRIVILKSSAPEY